MKVKVKQNYIKHSPQKVRPLLYLIRRKNASEAVTRLSFVKKESALFLAKLIKSGIAAAKEKELNIDSLFVSEVYCDQAPSLKRHRFRSRGRTAPIKKRASHLTLVLADKIETKKDQKETKENIAPKEKNGSKS